MRLRRTSVLWNRMYIRGDIGWITIVCFGVLVRTFLHVLGGRLLLVSFTIITICIISISFVIIDVFVIVALLLLRFVVESLLFREGVQMSGKVVVVEIGGSPVLVILVLMLLLHLLLVILHVLRLVVEMKILSLNRVRGHFCLHISMTVVGEVLGGMVLRIR